MCEIKDPVRFYHSFVNLHIIKTKLLKSYMVKSLKVQAKQQSKNIPAQPGLIY